MHYLNPISTLQLDAAQIASKSFSAYLKREKKRLLAAFELAEAPVIELNGQDLDKASVLALLEQLEEKESRAHHLRILEQAELQAFLEKSALAYYHSGDPTTLKKESKAFVKFVAPHYAHSFNHRLFKAFREKDWETLSLICASKLPIPNRFHAACYQDTFRYLHGYIQNMEKQAQAIESGMSPPTDLQDHSDEFLILSLNQLPAYFSGLRDQYATALEALAITVHNEHKRTRLALILIRQGLKLDLNPVVQRRLQHIQDQLAAQAPMESIWEELTGQSKQKSKGRVWLVGAAVVGVIYLVLRFIV